MYVFRDKVACIPLLRNVFNWFSYFFFIYGSIVGFMTAIVRLLLSLLFGTILLFRLDRNVMMPGFQFADFGQIIVASQHIRRVYYIKWNASKLD